MVLVEFGKLAGLAWSFSTTSGWRLRTIMWGKKNFTLH